MRMLSRKVVVGLVALLAMLLISCGTNTPSRILFPRTLPTPHSTRQIVSNDFKWEELWRDPMKLSYGSALLPVISKNKVILPVDAGSTGILMALNPHSGQTIWTQDFISPFRGDGQEVDSILADGEQVYMATPFVVKAFSIVDGQPRWTSIELPGHTGYDLSLSNHPDVIRVDGGSGYYANKKDGEITPAEQGMDVPEVTTDTLVCHYDLQYILTCMDRQTNQRLWQIQPGWPATGVSIGSKILVLLAGSHLNSLIGIDQATGKELWRVSDRAVLSNFIVFDDNIYAITSDVALVAYDPATGKEKGRMKFDGGKFDTDHGNRYWLLATDSEILVYFGDGQELIAFSPKQ
jgi:outer membrane protein assembly factor BamB